jgi:acyl-coenzyme A thioesterase PaaI-like protein
MTDIGGSALSVPHRLGVAAQLRDGEFTLHLNPKPELLHHGVVRASVLSFMIDAVAGISVDRDDAVWTLTTDMTVRMRPLRAPSHVSASNRILRRGRRSSTCAVDVTTHDGSPVCVGAIGFANVPRKPSDPPKPTFSPEVAARLMSGTASLTRPLRDEAGIEVVDASKGIVEVAVTPELRNPAGTLQGAMVALVVEAAAEDLMAARFGAPVVVADLDLRYLAQTQGGPVRTRSRLLGSGQVASVQVELFDTSTNRLTTLGYARTVRMDELPTGTLRN